MRAIASGNGRCSTIAEHAAGPALKELQPIGAKRRQATPTSIVLQRLHDRAPADSFTLGWLIGSLHERSFGIIMLILGLLAIAPGASFAAGLLLMILALEMIGGRPAPVFPRSIAARPLPTRYFAAVVRRAVPVLRCLERVIRPRWSTPLDGTKRLVGIMVLLLSTILVFAPIPLTNVVPALAIVLIALACLEADGLLLSIALVTAPAVLIVAFLSAWVAFAHTKWMIGFF